MLHSRRIWTAAVALLIGSVAFSASASAGSDSRIVWTSLGPEDSELRSANPDGTGFRKLTDPKSDIFHIDAAISPDGSTVAYGIENLEKGGGGIGVVGSDASDERALDLGCEAPCDIDLGPEWNGAGDRLTFTRVVGPFNGPGESAASAVLYSANALDGSDVQRFSEPGIDGVFEDYHANYSPDGSYIVFLRTRNQPFNFALFRMNADGSDIRQLTPWKLNADLPDLSPATSGPTEGLIVFETYGSGAPKGEVQNIATVPADCPSVSVCGKQIDYLTDEKSPVESFNPAWSPDGRRVAFTHFKDRGRKKPPVGDIWTMAADGGRVKAVTKSRRFDFRPDWGPAG